MHQEKGGMVGCDPFYLSSSCCASEWLMSLQWSLCARHFVRSHVVGKYVSSEERKLDSTGSLSQVTCQDRRTGRPWREGEHSP